MLTLELEFVSWRGVQTMHPLYMHTIPQLFWAVICHTNKRRPYIDIALTYKIVLHIPLEMRLNDKLGSSKSKTDSKANQTLQFNFFEHSPYLSQC